MSKINQGRGGVVAKTACPRCERSVAVLRFEGAVPVPFPHKGRNGQKCSGTPKTRAELVGDLLDVLKEEQELMSEGIDLFLEFGEKLAEVSTRKTGYEQRATALINKIADSLTADIAAREAAAAKQ